MITVTGMMGQVYHYTADTAMPDDDGNLMLLIETEQDSQYGMVGTVAAGQWFSWELVLDTDWVPGESVQ